MQLTYQHKDDTLALSVEPYGDGFRVRLPDGSERRITARRLPGGVLEVSEGERTFRVPFARADRTVELSLGGRVFRFEPAAERAGRTRRKASGALSAPMVGVITDVLVREGETVEAHQPLATMEAMKVLATVEAPFAGTVKAVRVRKGDRVEHGQLLVEVEPAAGEPT